MNVSVNVTKRMRRRKSRSGREVTHVRYVVNVSDRRTGRRHQFFFERRIDAIAKRDAILSEVGNGSRRALENKSCTVRQAVERYLNLREGEISPRTMRNYRQTARYVVGPILKGTAKERFRHANGRGDGLGEFLPSIGAIDLNELATADIRNWHKTTASEIGSYSADRAKTFLAAALSLAAEEFDVRPPPMPTRLGRGRRKRKKAILAPEQVARLIAAAQTDEQTGIYYAFPFLTGMRPSEQLGLLWSEIDFETNVIRVRRSQDLNGELVEFVKTEAGIRDVPMSETLRRMLLSWRVRCARRGGELHRMFPGLGRPQAWPKPRLGAGGPLLYANFRRRIWEPALKRLELPYVTPHSARHTFISTLQAQGIEVGLVAKLAGHANPSVTLNHYTQAVRGGEEAMLELEKAFKT